MQLSDLKKSLFGFDKDSVYLYVDTLDTEYSQNMQLLEARHQAQITELEAQNARLQETLAKTEKELADFRQQYDTIAQSIVDAKVFADNERNTTLQREAEARDEIKAMYHMGKAEAIRYLETVENCRKEITAELAKIENEMNERRAAISRIVRSGKEYAENAMPPLPEQHTPSPAKMSENVDIYAEDHDMDDDNDDNLFLFQRAGRGR